MPPHRRLLAWIYTGPPGHLWSTTIDIAVAWARWGGGKLRERATWPSGHGPNR